LNLGYLDDVPLGGPVDTVAADVAQIAKVGGDMGLHLNASKCELVALQNLSIFSFNLLLNKMRQTDELLQSFTRVDVGSASLLGAPLFHGSELDKSWSICCDDLLVESSLSSPFQRASFFAASSQHSGDWLFALPVASCGMRLDDEAVRVAIGLRLGLALCVPHQCHCETQVHGCIRPPCICLQKGSQQVSSAPRFERASSSCPLSSTHSSSVAEWKSSRLGCHSRLSFADSYVASAACREARSVAELAATKKEDKYSGLAGCS